MINWDAVAEWRNALRSGKYKQTKHKLRNKWGYCCLGVFCEAVAKIEPVPFDFDEDTGEILTWAYEDMLGGLSPSAISLSGIKEFPSVFHRPITILNDGPDNLSLDEIADLLDIAILEHNAGVPDGELFQ